MFFTLCSILVVFASLLISDTCMFGLWEMEVPLSHEICCIIPQTNDEEVAALNNYNPSQISRAALAPKKHLIHGE